MKKMLVFRMSPFPTMFSKVFLVLVVKTWDRVEKGKLNGVNSRGGNCLEKDSNPVAAGYKCYTPTIEQ